MKPKAQKSDRRASAELFLDTYHPKQDNTCNVKIRVYYNRYYKYYSTEIDLLPDEFNSVLYAKRKTPEQKATAAQLNFYLGKANGIIEKLRVFTFDIFEEAYFEKRNIDNSVSYAFEKYIKELKADDRIGTAVTYECAINSLEAYKKNLKFADVTPSFLKQYERYMIKNEKSTTTISMYLRSLRAIFNRENINKELYPFGRGKYEIPTAKNIKKALTMEEISLIFNHKITPGTNKDRARDYFIFMYLCNGMNVKDLCLLKWENIEDDFILYERAKTANTEKEKKPIRVALKPEAKDIIEKWGQLSLSKKTFVFPHLTSEMNAEREREVYQQLTKIINKYLKEIAAELRIDKNITTYAARHSFATVLKRSGADISMISDLLGHSNVQTTQSYLDSFEDDQIKKQTDVLTSGFNRISS